MFATMFFILHLVKYKMICKGSRQMEMGGYPYSFPTPEKLAKNILFIKV